MAGRTYTIDGYRLGKVVYRESDKNIISFQFKETWLVIEEDKINDDGSRDCSKHYYPANAVDTFTVELPRLSKEQVEEIYGNPSPFK